MMKMTGRAFAKKLFGAHYERLPQTLLMDAVVFWGLSIADFQIQIAPYVRILMISAFTAGVMWQALSSKDNAKELRHMLMLPIGPREFVFSYVAALGAYTVLTKTGLLLAVLLAVSAWKPVEVMGIMICMIHAVLMAAAVYSLRKYWYAGGLWTAAIAAAILFVGNRFLLGLLLLVSILAAALVLWKADGYAFYSQSPRRSQRGRAYAARSGKISRRQEPARGTRCAMPLWFARSGRLSRRQKPLAFTAGTAVCLIWRYFFRYLGCHKNYLCNTAVMWCVAVGMPYFLREMAGLSVVAVGFAILSLNTPICILLSCDRDLEQAVRLLPGQKRRFCIPYCLFIFLCNMAADVIFLSSWQLQNGGVTVFMLAGAVFFALQSAVLSVLLEWFYPVRSWKIESDLWHHPRKYMVPVAMLLLAGAVSACPALLYALLVLLAVEIVVLFLYTGGKVP